MAIRKKDEPYEPRTPNRRRGRLRPLNHCKRLSGKSAFRGQRKRKRGQG